MVSKRQRSGGSGLATRLGPGADPLREQWTASASPGTARGIFAVSSGYVARCAAASRRVSLAARTSSRSAVALPEAVGAWQGLRRRWQWVGRRLSFGGLGVCVSHPSDHRGLATLERACLGERQRSCGDTLLDRASVGGGRTERDQLAARRRDVCRWA